MGVTPSSDAILKVVGPSQTIRPVPWMITLFAYTTSVVGLIVSVAPLPTSTMCGTTSLLIAFIVCISFSTANDIIYRPKQGFRTPVQELFAGKLGEWSRPLLLETGFTKLGLLKKDALQALLDSVKEVEKDRHEMLLPECHQMRHLEDLEPALAQVVGLSVEEMPEWPAQRVVGKSLPQILILQRVHEVGHRASRALGQQLECAPERGALCGCRRDALQVEKHLEPLLGPSTLMATVDPREGREG